MELLEILKTIQERYAGVALAEFNENLQPEYLEEDDPYIIGNVYLVDQYGNVVIKLEPHETIIDAMKQLTETGKHSVVGVLEPELKRFAFLPK